MSKLDFGPDFPEGFMLGAKYEFQTRTGLVVTNWWCEFVRDAPGWKAVYLVEEDYHSELFGIGDTPRAAFESLVTRWTLANGGVESPMLRRTLPYMRQQLDEVGL